jgi:hypothetical protein
MSRASAWLNYVRARNTHFVCDDRLRDRPLSITSVEPPRLSDRELREWSELLNEAEEAARAHRESFECYRSARAQHASPADTTG